MTDNLFQNGHCVSEVIPQMKTPQATECSLGRSNFIVVVVVVVFSLLRMAGKSRTVFSAIK